MSEPRGRERIRRLVEEMYTANGGWPIHITEIIAATGTSRSTIHTHLVNLVREGILEKGPTLLDGWRPTSGGRLAPPRRYGDTVDATNAVSWQ